MLVIHATILASGMLCLWVEDDLQDTREHGVHPRAGDALRAQEVVGRLLDLPAQALLPASREVLHLPSVGATPLPSRGSSVPAWVSELAPWWVAGCLLRPSEATLLLAHVEAPDGLSLGGDLVAWSAAARWTLSLLLRQRMVPDLTVGEAGARAGWLPSLDAARDPACLDALSRALPPSAVCFTADPPPAREVLLGFVRTALDELARHWIARSGLPGTAAGGDARAWLEALRSGRHGLDADVGALAGAVRRWHRDLLPESDRLDFRTGFALSAPPVSAAAERARPPSHAAGGQGPTPREDGEWLVRVFLEAVDEPAIRVPADDIGEGVVSAGPYRLEHPRQVLLADLGRALRIFPALERMLSEPGRMEVALGLPEACHFVRSTAWLLQESGFAVDLPSWVAGGPPRLEMSVRERPEGGFGLDALLDYEWSVALGGDRMDPRDFQRLAEEKLPLVRLREDWALVEPGPAADLVGLWSAREGRPLTLREALQLAAGALDGPVVDVDFGWLDEPPLIEPPPGLRAQLRPYQHSGLSWLADRVRRGLGACLADDMGLGKTIQTISLLLWDGGRGPWLLVCPMSLVGNWQRELARFAPSLRVAVCHGRSRSWDEADVVLTTYGMVTREEALGARCWRGVVLDEAQNVKNADSRQARAVRALQAEARIALTGTPVENRLSDLWSIMEFLNPGLLGTPEAFRRRFSVPIERYADEERRGHLRRAVQPFLLRRVKSDPRIVPDLPEKHEARVYCSLTREQASLYEATVRDRLERIDQSDGIARRGMVLATMLRLKQICNHPAHFLGDGSALAGRSGKLARLEEMLEEVMASGERALVFTQFREWATALSSHLSERLGCEVPCLHGEISREERERMVTRFQSDDGPPVFVLSVKAGGVGLNLTRASHIFHYDRWWNPAVENQATDRAFRIGQRRDVQVHKFVCVGTLEEAIDGLLDAKRGLAESVVGTGEAWLTELSTGELREMLRLREGCVEE